MIAPQDIIIRGFQSPEECDRAARLMMRTDPWKTFGRTYENCLDAVTNPQKEAFGAFTLDGTFLGLVVIDLTGPLKGYLQAVCLDENVRGQGLGSRLIRFAEERVFSVTPNCFLCYSDFNSSVRTLYEHLGYSVVGEMPEYMIPGHAEILMRKSIGPVMTYKSK